MIKRILVTGGAGFIGSHLVKRLVKQGHDVIATDNLERGKFEFLSEIANEPNFHFLPCDLTNYNDVKGLFTNCEVVIHHCEFHSKVEPGFEEGIADRADVHPVAGPPAVCLCMDDKVIPPEVTTHMCYGP